MSKDLGASIRSRLLNLAKAEQSDFNQVLVRYALEPAGLSDEFANDPARQKMWLALLQKNAITIIPLAAVVTAIRKRIFNRNGAC